MSLLFKFAGQVKVRSLAKAMTIRINLQGVIEGRLAFLCRKNMVCLYLECSSTGGWRMKRFLLLLAAIG